MPLPAPLGAAALHAIPAQWHTESKILRIPRLRFWRMVLWPLLRQTLLLAFGFAIANLTH